jgi:hypothetical protein
MIFFFHKVEVGCGIGVATVSLNQLILGSRSRRQAALVVFETGYLSRCTTKIRSFDDELPAREGRRGKVRHPLAS